VRDFDPTCSEFYADGGLETGILLPNNQRQHRTSHAPKDVLPLRICDGGLNLALSQPAHTWFKQGLGFRVFGSGFCLGLGSRVLGLVFKVEDLGFKV